MDNGKRKCEDNPSSDDDEKTIDLTLKLGPPNYYNPELEDDATSKLQRFPAPASQFNDMGNWNGGYGRPTEVAYNWPREVGGSNYMLYHQMTCPCPAFNMVFIPNLKRPVAEDDKACNACGSIATPLWRKGPDGPQTLCNACGLRYLRTLKRGEE